MITAEQTKFKETAKLYNSKIEELNKKIEIQDKTVASLQDKIRKNEAMLSSHKETEKEIQKATAAKPITHNRASQCNILPTPGANEADLKSPPLIPERAKQERKTE